MKINLDSIKELRSKTMVSLNDCKKALEESSGDIKKAISKLMQLKKFDLENNKLLNNRSTLNGLIVMHLDEKLGILIELNCETDFVAKNKNFIELAKGLVFTAYKNRCYNINRLLSNKYKENINALTVEEAIKNSELIFSERLKLSKLSYLEAKENEVIAGYIHGDIYNSGKIGALVALQSSSKNKLELQKIGKQIAMHIVATKPIAISIKDLNELELNNELSLIKERVKILNKPKEIEKKIVSAKISKYYEEVVLLEQKFVMDNKIKICDFIKSSELSLNSSIKIVNYKLLILGNVN